MSHAIGGLGANAAENLQRRVRREFEPDWKGVEEVARIAHEMNRAYCAVLGDDSQLPWDEAPVILKDSIRQGVRDIVLDPHNYTPERSHNRWMSYKLREGWRYGPVKDVEAKTHPNLLPYEELSEEEQLKDMLFGSVVMCLRNRTVPKS